MRNTQAMKIRKAPLIFFFFFFCKTLLPEALGKGAEASVCELGLFTEVYKMESPLINLRTDHIQESERLGEERGEVGCEEGKRDVVLIRRQEKAAIQKMPKCE